jgi:hypothetical protein
MGALLGAVVLGCPGGADQGPSIVLEDFYPPDVAEPRETWKDDATGLVFITPGLGWRRMEASELTVLGPNVKLGVEEGKRCRGWALAQPAGEVATRTAAEEARKALTWDGLELRVDEYVKYDLWTARRYEVQGQVEGRTLTERASFWIDDGTLYTVVARTNDRDFTSRRRCLDRVTAGFSLASLP